MLKLITNTTRRNPAERADMDGRILAAQLRSAKHRSDLDRIHKTFTRLAGKYSAAGFPEFEIAYYEANRT